MGHYKSNLRDIEFNLFEVFDTGARLGVRPFDELDAQTARGILTEVRRLAEGPLAESYLDSDRNPPIFDPATSSVAMPESFKKSYRAWADAQWWRLELGAEYGGTVAPRSLVWAIAELVLGANPAVWMYDCAPGFVEILRTIATTEQKKVGQIIVDRRWGATMVLTEPEAGSDVGAARARAIVQDDGSWHIEGVKRFITSAEHDLAENIVHFVLARPEGAAAGTKGLSMFMVPKFQFDWNSGEVGERNGVFVTAVEHKMGLKVSTTCELRFGEHHPAVGWLVGEVHDGIAQMFRIIENARMMVGTKAYAQLSTGYLHALEFAKARVQSADLTRSGDKTAPRVTIINHPDVRRSLMLQKSYAEGLRAVAMFTADVQDRLQIARDTGTATDADERLNDLLLPIVKGASSERAYEQLAQSLQTLGGSGYLQDYPIEQYLRDTKIDSLYEGTTGIQGQDFFFRKIVKDGGIAVGMLTAQIQAFLGSIAEQGRLKAESESLTQALRDFGLMVGAMTTHLAQLGEDARNIYKIGQNTTRLLLSAGDLMIGYLLIRQASVALSALDAEGVQASDVAFYEGKVAVAKFFAASVLPELSARRHVVQGTDNALMDLPEASF